WPRWRLVHRSRPRRPLEVAEQVLVGAQLPEGADEFDGDDLAVGERGLGAALAEAAEVQGLQFVVHEAKYLKQEFLRGHGGLSLVNRVVSVDVGRTTTPFPAANYLHTALARMTLRPRWPRVDQCCYQIATCEPTAHR